MTDQIQQQLITARKNQILDSAAIVFAKKGFHPATIRDIAQHAGIADGTIYNYFDNKTALLMGIFERMRASVIERQPPLPAGDIDLRAFIKTFLAHPMTALKEDDFALFRIVISEMMVNPELSMLYFEKILEPTLQMAKPIFQELVASRGSSLKGEDIDLTIRVISGLMMGMMLGYIIGDDILRERWDDLPDFLADLILNSLEAKSQ